MASITVKQYLELTKTTGAEQKTCIINEKTIQAFSYPVDCEGDNKKLLDAKVTSVLINPYGNIMVNVSV